MLRLEGQDNDGNNGAKGRHGQEGDKTSRLEGREVGGFEDQETHLMKSEQLPSRYQRQTYGRPRLVVSSKPHCNSF
jgi:hypothetical protein